MPRYMIRPRSEDWCEDEGALMLGQTIIDTTDHDPVPTGLITQHGHSICRVPEPIGFDLTGQSGEE